MPRKPRILSDTGIYHIFMRGNEKKDIFHDIQDREIFLEILNEKKREGEFKLFSYCLMGNHIHLLLKEQKDSISRAMKRINSNYAAFYNKKYHRVGHVFQDRYKSEPIENDTYLLEVLRYIHNNPVKAKIVDDPTDYFWSSYPYYLNKLSDKKALLEIDEILNLFSCNRIEAVEQLRAFTKREDSREFLDLIDEEHCTVIIHGIKEELAKEYKIKTEELSTNKHFRDILIKRIKRRTNFSIRVIAKELGIDKNIIARVR